jgi:carboxylesterase
MKTQPLITLPGGEAYYLPGSADQCVVLVHGYTGTPGELRLLGAYLNKLGLSVIGVRLPGHGTNIDDLEHTTFADWYEEVLRNVAKARTLARKVSLVGSSMGAAVVLKVAATTQLYKSVVMSAPLETYNKHYQYAKWFHFIHPVEKKKPVSLTYPPNITPATMNFPCCHCPAPLRKSIRCRRTVCPRSPVRS